MARELERWWRRPWFTRQRGLSPFGETFLDRLMSEWPHRNGEEVGFHPRIDFKVDDGHYRVTAELPGVSKEDISVNVDLNTLTISGEKRYEKEDERGDYYFRETGYGSFSRSINLPTEVDEKQVDATFENGVLELVLPAKEETRTRKQIEIK